MSELLKVGELAKRTGVTVRALHHYDSIGLLRPSGRSDAGYRLYGREDVARLHGIQTLRQLGVPLAAMAPLLDGGERSLQAILARQLSALDERIASAKALRERVGVMQMVLAQGGQPAIGDWLASLAMMQALEEHFSAGELGLALQRWKLCEADWLPLGQAWRSAMDRGLPSDAIENQALVQRWLDLMVRWMGSDVPFMDRWGRMVREHPGLPLPEGMDPPLAAYIDEAVRRRLAAVDQQISPQLRQRLHEVRPEWRALIARGHRLMADDLTARSPAARAFARDWHALMERTFGSDIALRDRVTAAYENDPMLQAGMPFTAALRAWVEQASGP